ncbi:hypothetical protein A2715_02320 [Candidatus Woesebacteria bacterium RIFCSPHIGHO2_01_FULL_39_32]|uniref:Polymerase nucleotidyl transferase domain-containing protein n=1 Tax=Candidatus Woesebacteria bacterium RIFCSPLOWO2_01_FULL_39_25 TaxID=1802521 RepID=A0A1F8BJD0_9BACT|nr:MAG: hypothetical protein A2124_01800 [Candidatus Woesebacteria bacterium GWB1_37_5]OGM23985.1 MAG: hypothetical protein A2715_02320 [Candidatus Woesebacteria bacterium RIFCSPHIGHO2_01_FULL_39_32]OGM37491.1 MAG: hypothetical protein A3F01_03555 [Candidatus Woesebacteria bacterium RIFCSPHIGHO2_12_FULL_38_11]OGM64174.1 MAG: hypothetical protein A2893_03560 [Candidatus Woesebacteria bacterium RIFCSPLOWO2_01_FULL_39_25]
MNNVYDEFVEDLKKRSDVLGIILFGSWARGNNRPDSDVDLVVILKEGFRRTVEYRGSQAFEIIYTIDNSAFDYWESHKDDCAGLWEVAKVLYDKNGTIQRLQKRVKRMLKPGKKPYDQYQLGQLRFDAEDQLNYVKKIRTDDPTTARMILLNKVFVLTELFFDIKQLWTPAPKQRLMRIKNIAPSFYELLVKLYRENRLLEQEKIAEAIIDFVFSKS